MSEYIRFFLSLVLAYGIGAAPVSILLTRMFHIPDPRTYGTGNIGATNVARKNIMLGVSVFVIDNAKVALAVLCAYILGIQTVAMECIWAITILGQTRSVFLQFTGGKGVSCFVGGIAVLYPLWFIPLSCISYIVYVASGRVWMSSVTAVALFAIISLYLPAPIAMIHGAIAAWILYLHRNNFTNSFVTEKTSSA